MSEPRGDPEGENSGRRITRCESQWATGRRAVEGTRRPQRRRGALRGVFSEGLGGHCQGRGFGLAQGEGCLREAQLQPRCPENLWGGRAGDQHPGDAPPRRGVGLQVCSGAQLRPKAASLSHQEPWSCVSKATKGGTNCLPPTNSLLASDTRARAYKGMRTAPLALWFHRPHPHVQLSPVSIFHTATPGCHPGVPMLCTSPSSACSEHSGGLLAEHLPPLPQGHTAPNGTDSPQVP